MKNIDWKQVFITGATVLAVLFIYDKWIGPMVTKKVA
jgi:hypothetical protein